MNAHFNILQRTRGNGCIFFFLFFLFPHGSAEKYLFLIEIKFLQLLYAKLKSQTLDSFPVLYACNDEGVEVELLAGPNQEGRVPMLLNHK